MELLQKTSSKYLLLSFTVLMGAMLVVSCDNRCGNKGADENTDNPSISFEKDHLVGPHNTTQLQVEGSAYQAGDFKIKVRVTNGSIKIGGETFTDAREEEKLLAKILGIPVDERVKGEKVIAVEVIPTDLAVALSASVKLIDQEGNEISSGDLRWVPALLTGLEVAIGDVAGDKITVVVKAKKDGSPVNIEVADLANLEMKLTKNPNDAEAASIVETLELTAGDINAGSISKQFTVKRGTKDTQLALAVINKKDGKILAEKKNILVKAIVTYKLAPIARIEDGATKVKIIVKGLAELQATELEKLKLQVKSKVGSKATIGGQSAGLLELKHANALSISATNKKEASVELVIDPQGDSQVIFQLSLLDGEDTVQDKQTLEWEDGFAIAFTDVMMDNANKSITYKLHNLGKSKIEVAKLAVQVTNCSVKEARLNGDEYKPNEKKIVNTVAIIGKTDIEAGHSSTALSAVIDNMANTDKAVFELELIYNNQPTGIRETVSWLAEGVQLYFVYPEKAYLVGDRVEANCGIQNSRASKTEANKLALHVKKIAGDNAVKLGGIQINQGAEADIDLSTHNFVIDFQDGEKPLGFVLEANGGNQAEFEMQLKYDGVLVGTKKIVNWKKEKEVKLRLVDPNEVALNGGNKTFTIAFKKETEDFLDINDLDKITIKINQVDKSSPSKITYKDITGDEKDIISGVTTVSDLLGLWVDLDQAIDDIPLTLDVAAATDFTIELVGSTADSKYLRKRITYTP